MKMDGWRLAGEFEPAFGVADGSSSLVIGFIGADLLVSPDGVLAIGAELAELAEQQKPEDALLIGKLGHQPVTLLRWPAATPCPRHLRKAHWRTLAGHYEANVLEAANRAIQLAAWLQAHRFCGACGQALTQSEREPARLCPGCGFRAYPRISPVAIVLVLRGQEMLLARSPHFQAGIYSALAGFVEAGESLEACARREVREEVGIDISNLRWFGSQAWPYPHSLMLGFIADYAGGELSPQQGEIEDAGWFAFDKLPALPHPSSIAARMIQAVVAEPERYLVKV